MKHGVTILILLYAFFRMTDVNGQPLTGKILFVSEQTVTINMGVKDGIQTGTMGKIYQIFEFRGEKKKIFYADVRVEEVMETESKCIIANKILDKGISAGLFADFYLAAKLSSGETDELPKRAYAYYAENKLQAALEMYKRVLAKNPFDTNAQKMIKNIEEELTTEGSGTLHEKMSFWLKKAEEAVSKDAYKDAITYYTNALALDPENHSIYVNRGIAFRRSQQYTKAINDYTKAIELNPSEVVYVYRGIVYFLQEKFGQAIADFSEALKINSEFSDGYYHRGNAYMRSGDYNKASEDFIIYLQLKPDAEHAEEVKKLIKSMGITPEQ